VDSEMGNHLAFRVRALSQVGRRLICLSIGVSLDLLDGRSQSENLRLSGIVRLRQ
jgi:hypothetical protein